MAVTWNPRTNSLEYTPDLAAPKANSLAALEADIAAINATTATANKIAADTGTATSKGNAPYQAPKSSAQTTSNFTTLLSGLSQQQGVLDAAAIAAAAANNPKKLTQAELDAATKSDYDVAQAAALAAGGPPPIKPVVTNTNTNTSSSATTLTSAQQDAYALLEDIFRSYGLESLIPVIKGYMQQNIGPNQASLLLKQTPEYKTRFAGNYDPTYGRVAKGLNALSEAEYLNLENNYAMQMTAYGQGTLANKAQFANLIGNDISATELKDRLDLAVTQVQQADPTVMATLRKFYPTITDANLVGYFLNPADTLPMLNRQVQAADIGAAATQQGLGTDKTSAEALAAYGTTYAQAQAGYGRIAEVLPTSQKLSNIYGGQTGINYNQAEGESEFLKNSGAAALERQKLKDLEQAQFSGRSGVLGANVAAGYSGSLGKSIQGSF
jgi:hypothetical protein